MDTGAMGEGIASDNRLFGCTGIFIIVLTFLEIWVKNLLSILEEIPSKDCWWTFKIMATSSNEVFPARSPIPFMVHLDLDERDFVSPQLN